MEVEGVEIIRLELKYCERCGGLWMRLYGSAEAYCPPCAVQMSQVPLRGGKSKPRLPINHECEVRDDGNHWTVVCGQGGTA
jgi:hypothetical protein